MLSGKTILLGVTGGIAAYKAAALASALVKLHASVEVVMTRNATQFITPLTFEQLTGNRTMVDTFDRNFSHQVEHIALADRTDLVIVAPATANVCAKLAHGLADDMLTTTVLACPCPKLIAPAMNTKMYENPVTQDNLNILRHYGWEVVEPASGYLACGAVGKGKLPEPEALLQVILHYLAHEKDMAGKKGHPGGVGPGALPHQPLQRQDGLRHRPGGGTAWGTGDIGLRAGGVEAAALCGDGGRGVCAGDVRSGDDTCGGAGHYHQSGCRGRLSADGGGRGQDEEVR